MTRLVLFLFGGDYLEASRRREQGLADRYRHHGYALDTLEQIRETIGDVVVVTMRTEAAYDESSSAGLRFVGLGPGAIADKAPAVAAILDEPRATHAMLRFPSTGVLRLLLDRRIRVSLALADSFPKPWRSRSAYKEIGRLLRDPGVDFVANHQLNSSRQLVKVFGLDEARVVPWDWPLDLVAESQSAARVRRPDGGPRLCYVGTVSPTKGVWDLLDAVAILRKRGLDVSLDIAGTGKVEEAQELIRAKGLDDRVELLGRVGGDEILDRMRAADFVCVPSRRIYPEGLPLTIYEAMASGTPIVASDHAMFKGVVRDGETGLVFRSGRPEKLASAVSRGWQDPDLYAHLSRTAAAAYRELGLDTLWGELALRWTRGTPDDDEWIRARSLRALGR